MIITDVNTHLPERRPALTKANVYLFVHRATA
jgi:hypothetical protein